MKWLKVALVFPILLNGLLQFLGIMQGDNERVAELQYAEMFRTDELSASFRGEEGEDQISWSIRFEQLGKEPKRQKVKLQIQDSANQPIPQVAGLKIPGIAHEEGWLRELDFTDETLKEFSFDLPKEYATIHLQIQLDEIRQVEKEQRIERDDGEEVAASSQEEAVLKVEEPVMDVLPADLVGTHVLTLKLASDSEESAQESTGTSSQVEEAVNQKESERAEPEEEKGFWESVKEVFTGEIAHQSAPQVSTTQLFYAQLYPNKKPVYTIDDKIGTFPTDSWKPSGQEDVINHQGGRSDETGWDGVTKWDVSQDDRTQSYIHHGMDADTVEPSVSIRKYASQTETPDLFNVRLNVRGKTTYQPGVDVVLLLDNTGSFGQNYNYPKMAKRYAEEALDKLLTELTKAQAENDIRIGAHIFSDFTHKNISGVNGQWPVSKTTHEISDDPQNWRKISTDYKALIAEANTFTQRGLMEANALFERGDSDGLGRRKVMLVLTDGGPNIGYRPTSDANISINDNIFMDKIHIDKWDRSRDALNKNPEPPYSTKNRTQFLDMRDRPLLTDVGLGEDHKLSSYISITNSTAYDIKQSGVEIHGIGVNIQPPTGNVDHSVNTIHEGLARMTTKRANASSDTSADYFYQRVDNLNNLLEEMKTWYQTIINTVEKGILVDPIGEMVELPAGVEPVVTLLDKNGTPIPKPLPPNEDAGFPKLIVSQDRRTIRLENITLTDDQELQIDYQVKLKSKEEGVKDNTWYQTNGQTTLNPLPEHNHDVIDFGVPSVRRSVTSVAPPVEKAWQDTVNDISDYWQIRPGSIDVFLQRYTPTGWENVAGPLKLSQIENQWQALFPETEVDEATKYRIVEVEGSKERIKGYGEPTYSLAEFYYHEVPESGIKITNPLLTTDYQFKKLMSDGKTPFTDPDELPVFKIAAKTSGREIDGVMPDADGIVTFKDLPIGEYTISESEVPAGHLPMVPFDIKIYQDPNDLDKLIIEGVGHQEPLVVINEKIRSKVIVKKFDMNENALEGAKFKLTGPDYERELGPDLQEFVFADLKPGTYYLEETQYPEGFANMAFRVKIEIDDLGRITVQNHELIVDSHFSEATATIQLDIANVPVGKLPETGSTGMQMLRYALGIFAVTGVGTILYLYRREREQL